LKEKKSNLEPIVKENAILVFFSCCWRAFSYRCLFFTAIWYCASWAL